MMQAHGQQGGHLYEKHRRKIDSSLGYMRDGNVSHYVAVGFRPKTKDRDRYGPEKLGPDLYAEGKQVSKAGTEGCAAA